MTNPLLYPRLFQPGRMGRLPLRNRVIMGVYPTQYARESQVTERMLWFYRARARGGVAMIVVEGPCLDYPHDYRGETQLRLDEDAFLPGLRRLTQAIQSQGARAFLQLNYPARIGPSQMRVSVADEADTAQLAGLAHRFGQAARRAQEAGFDGVEVQAGWGELASRLLSPAGNRRTDDYGGPLANRARFLLEAIAAIQKEAGPGFPIQVKMAAREYLPGGFDLEEAKALATMLEKAGVASILVSAGTGETRRWGVPPQAAAPALLVPLAAQVKQAVGIPVVAVGKIKGPHLAESILETGQADFIALTRALIADPDWPRKAQEGRPQDIRGCIYCLQDCSGDGVPGLGRACTVNPYTGREGEIRIRRARKSKKVVVIGAGPAGLQAAVTAAERGHSVHLYEQAPRLGGVFGYPLIAGYKGDVAELPRYLAHRVQQLGVRVSVATRLPMADILAEKPDAVLVATGCQRLIPPYPGVEGPNVVEARSLWDGRASAGRRVAIIGAGSVACEVGEWLAGQGSEVTVLARGPAILRDMNAIPRAELLGRLGEKRVKILVKAQVVRIEPQRLVYRDEEGEKSLAIDTVVLAVGGQPDRSLAQGLEGRVAEVYLAGDCDQPGTGGMAIRAGLAVGMRI